jgi:hypothetical protein
VALSGRDAVATSPTLKASAETARQPTAPSEESPEPRRGGAAAAARGIDHQGMIGTNLSCFSTAFIVVVPLRMSNGLCFDHSIFFMFGRWNGL